MRIGINMMLWTGAVERADVPHLTELRRLGYDAVEIPLLNDEALRRSAWLAPVLDELGLDRSTSTAMPPGASLLREAEVEQGMRWLRACIDATAALGARVLCGPVYHQVGQFSGGRPTAAEWASCVRALRAVGEYAAGAGVTVAVEPLNRFETYFLNTVEQGARLVEAVGSPHVRLLLDTFHMNVEEDDLPAAIRRARACVGHVHLSENHRGSVGAGHIPWRAVIAALREIGYEGLAVVESFSSRLEELARATCIWRDLAPSEEALAGDSLRYLRELLANAS